MKQITDYLVKLGLSEIESILYQGLLEKKQTTIMELADHVGINRVTVHFNIGSLIKKGLVTQTMHGSRRRIMAEPPDSLQFFIDDKIKQLNSIKADFPKVLDYMNNQIPNQISDKTPFFKYYEGEKGFKEVCQRSLDFAKGEILFLSNLDEWYKVYTEQYDKSHYIPSRLKRKILLKMLVFPSPLTQKMQNEDKKLLRETKFLPLINKFNTTILIYDNEVSMMMSNKPYTAIVINNKEYYYTFYSLFSTLWSMAK